MTARRGRRTLMAVAVGVVTAFGVAACGGSTTIGTTGPGGSNGSGGTSGTGASGGGSNGPGGFVSSGGQGAAGRFRCTADTDCPYDTLCIYCPDGIESCPIGASCIGGQCVTKLSHECGSGGGGSGGSGGSSGASSGGAGGGVSPGKVSIEFTVTGPESYCAPICPAPEIKIQDSSGRALILTEFCQVDCGSCFKTCPFCLNVGTAVTGIKMDWDGTVYQGSTCGAGSSCVEPTFASPGKYTATFCATPGTLTGPDGGLGQCVTSGSPKCGTVIFDFPSSVVVKGTVGP